MRLPLSPGMKPPFAFLLLACCLGMPAADTTIALCCDRTSAPEAFAADEIRAAAQRRGMTVAERPLAGLASATGRLVVVARSAAVADWRAARSLAAAPDARQAYALHRLPAGGVAAIGNDAAGAMYAGLDVAEAIAAGRLDALAARTVTPRVERRGLKFNLPLDVRTPSYSDAGDQAQASIPAVWEESFWNAFLDEMARARFNVISLWNLEPFPSLVTVPEYPDVALDDVWRTTWKLDEGFKGTAVNMVRPEMLRATEVVKRMPIAEKTRFWNRVMERARDRGIEVFLFTWNIYPFAAAGKHGLTDDERDPRLPDYYRASVRAAFKAFPLLAGIGFTAGERTDKLKKSEEREDWLWKAYGEAVRDVKREQPDRPIRTIHRLHYTNLKRIYEQWQDCPEPFDVSFKYSVAHVHSIPDPPFIKPTLADLPAGRKLWLTVRNDDFYSFRWGDPVFVRDFVAHLPPQHQLAGYYFGWDGFVPTYDFPAVDADGPRRLVLAKWWFAMRLWGTISMDPGRDASWERDLLAGRFAEVDSAALQDAWARASRTFARVTQVHWGDIDVKWLPEANTAHPYGPKSWWPGWKDVRAFIGTGSMPGSGVASIKDHVAAVARGQMAKGTSPLAVADAMEGDAQAALAWCATQAAATGELRRTVDDIAAMARLGAYYAVKIRGSVALALFEAGAGAEHQQAAVGHLTTALERWKDYADIYGRLYRPQLMTRSGRVDIPGFTRHAAADIAIAQGARAP